MSITRFKSFVKFRCNDCGETFYEDEFKVYTERQGFSEPPYEQFAVCPCCNSTNFEGVDEDENT